VTLLLMPVLIWVLMLALIEVVRAFGRAADGGAFCVAVALRWRCGEGDSE